MSITHPRREITFLRVGREERDRRSGDLLAASTIRAAAKLWRGGGCLSTFGKMEIFWPHIRFLFHSCGMEMVESHTNRRVMTSEIMDASVPIHLRG